MADVSLNNTNKKLLIAGIPVSVTGGIAEAGISIEPQGDRRVAVRGLFGEGVWIKINNDGHWRVVINTLETSQLNTILWAALIGDAILPLYYEDGGTTVFSGDGMVMTAPTMMIAPNVQTHAYVIESFNFNGVLTGRLA